MKTTKQNFETFKKEALYWLDYFHLHNWAVYFAHRKLRSDARAECYFRMEARISTITLAIDWDEVDDVQLRKSAFHEVCELLLAPIASLAGFFCQTVVQEAAHDIVRRLENTVFKQRMEQKKKG